MTLIKYVQSRQGARMWEYEAMTLAATELPSAILLGSLVQSVVDAIFFQVTSPPAQNPPHVTVPAVIPKRHLSTSELPVVLRFGLGKVS